MPCGGVVGVDVGGEEVAGGVTGVVTAAVGAAGGGICGVTGGVGAGGVIGEAGVGAAVAVGAVGVPKFTVGCGLNASVPAGNNEELLGGVFGGTKAPSFIFKSVIVSLMKRV